jgi:hypothetical protein
MATVAEVFHRLGQKVTMDSSLVKRLHHFQVSFTTRSEEHAAFFGGNLLGVHQVRFRPSDREAWFDTVLELDEQDIKDGLRECPGIDPGFKVSSDAFNQSCIWLLHALYASKLPEGQKQAAMLDTALIYQYKLISSLLAHYFPYPADESVAIATYAELSRKFALKVYGSWGALLQARALDIIGDESIHKDTIRVYNSDKGVVYMANDVQGRIREIINSLTVVFYRVKESGKKYTLVSATMERDGLQVVKDKHSNYQTYTRYLKEVMSDKVSFIRSELTSVISDAMHTMPEHLLDEVLGWMSAHHNGRHPEVDGLVDGVLHHAYDYVTHNRDFNAGRVDLGLLLARLRALYMASRMADPELLKNKELAASIVVQAVKTKNPSIQASLRTALQLYAVLRAFSMSYYT